MKYSFKKYILLSVPVFRQQVHIRAKKRHSLSESVLSPAVNYFRACLNIHLFLLKLAM